jgi:S1-C subfamily serine protease
MVKVAALTEKLIDHLATDAQRLEYIHIAAPADKGVGPPGAKLRLIPDYSDESNKGVLVESVVENGPAAKGGVRPGDRILDIGGLPTLNVNTYMTAMQRQKAGVAVEVTLERKGEKLKVKVIPE